jgi:hypothetical protein
MKILLLVALVGSAMGLSMPVLAQQQKEIDPEVRRQIEAVSKQFQDTYNRGCCPVSTMLTGSRSDFFKLIWKSAYRKIGWQVLARAW